MPKITAWESFAKPRQALRAASNNHKGRGSFLRCGITKKRYSTTINRGCVFLGLFAPVVNSRQWIGKKIWGILMQRLIFQLISMFITSVKPRTRLLPTADQALPWVPEVIFVWRGGKQEMRGLLAFASEAFQCFVRASNRPMLINLITDSKRFIFFFFFFEIQWNS